MGKGAAFTRFTVARKRKKERRRAFETVARHEEDAVSARVYRGIALYCNESDAMAVA